MTEILRGRHRTPSAKELSKNKDAFVVLTRIVGLVVALRTLSKTRRDGGDRLEQVDGLILLAGSVTSLLIGVRKLRAARSEHGDGT